jgi:hypothetical protein
MRHINDIQRQSATKLVGILQRPSSLTLASAPFTRSRCNSAASADVDTADSVVAGFNETDDAPIRELEHKVCLFLSYYAIKSSDWQYVDCERAPRIVKEWLEALLTYHFVSQHPTP